VVAVPLVALIPLGLLRGKATGWSALEEDSRRNHASADELLQRLEEYRLKKRGYPESLTSVATPEMCRYRRGNHTRDFYYGRRGDKDAFVLSFHIGGMYSMLYRSWDGRWERHYDD
jgi:hypothetical protein